MWQITRLHLIEQSTQDVKEAMTLVFKQRNHKNVLFPATTCLCISCHNLLMLAPCTATNQFKVQAIM